MANEFYISAGFIPNDIGEVTSSNTFYISAGLIPDDSGSTPLVSNFFKVSLDDAISTVFAKKGSAGVLTPYNSNIAVNTLGDKGYNSNSVQLLNNYKIHSVGSKGLNSNFLANYDDILPLFLASKGNAGVSQSLLKLLLDKSLLSFLGKKGNSGDVNQKLSNNDLTNSGIEGLNSIFDTLIDDLFINVLSKKKNISDLDVQTELFASFFGGGTFPAIFTGVLQLLSADVVINQFGSKGLKSIFQVLVKDLLVSTLGKTKLNSVIQLFFNDLVFNGSGNKSLNSVFNSLLAVLAIDVKSHKGNVSKFDIQTALFLSLFGGGVLPSIFTGVLSLKTLDNLINLAGVLGNAGTVSINITTGLDIIGKLGVTSTLAIESPATVDLLGKLGYKGTIPSILKDLDIRLIEIVISDRIYKIVMSMKTGQISILDQKTGTISITQ